MSHVSRVFPRLHSQCVLIWSHWSVSVSWALLTQYCNNGTTYYALQAVCSGDEAAIFTAQDSFTLSVEHLGQLVGSLSLARRVLAGPSKGEGLPYCIQDEELWGEGVSG